MDRATKDRQVRARTGTGRRGIVHELRQCIR